MKKFLTTNLVVSLLTITMLWSNFLRIDEIRYNDWRSDIITGYEFQEAPEYFKHLENRKITLFILQEILILTSGLLLMKGLEKRK